MKRLLFLRERSDCCDALCQLSSGILQFGSGLLKHGGIRGLGLFRFSLRKAGAEQFFLFLEVFDALFSLCEFARVNGSRAGAQSFLQLCLEHLIIGLEQGEFLVVIRICLGADGAVCGRGRAFDRGAGRSGLLSWGGMPFARILGWRW